MSLHFEISKRWPWHIRYPLALAIFFVALLLRHKGFPEQSGLAFITFYPAVILCFFLFGPWPGAMVAILSGLAGYYFFIPPYCTFSTEVKTYISLPFFAMTCTLIGYVITELHTHFDVVKDQNLRLKKLNSIYQATLKIEKVISQKCNPLTLFNEVTRIVVELAGLKLAWIATCDRDKQCSVSVASYGDVAANLDKRHLSICTLAPDKEICKSACLENKTVLVHDILHSPLSKYWHEQARKYGIYSFASIPIRVDGKMHGALNLYSSEKNAFNEEAVSLLETIAMNLGHAIQEFNLERMRQEAIHEMLATKNHLEHLLQHSPAIMYACRATGDYGATFISENIRSQLGYEPTEFIDDSAFWLNHIHADDREAVLEGIKTGFHDGSHCHEYRFQHKNGDYRWMRDELTLIWDDDGQAQEMVGFWMDITTRRELEKSLRLRQFSIDHADEQIFWIDKQGKFIDVNQTACQQLGYSRDELLTLTVKNVDVVFPFEQWADHWQELQAKSSLRFESVHRNKAGKTYPTEIIANFFEYEGAEYNCAFVRDISERKKLEDQLRDKANFDYLTGVHARGHFMELAKQELKRAIRYRNPLSILMMDIDSFKSINDSYGHRVGDLVLKMLTKVCQTSLRENDIFGRLGGEEFAVVLPETDNNQASEVAERLRKAVSLTQVSLELGFELKFTVSIGVAILSPQNEDIEVLLNQADKALYQAKAAGKNQVILFSADQFDR